MLTWPEPEIIGGKILAYQLNIRDKRGKWVQSETCRMETKSIYWSHKSDDGVQFFACFVETFELEEFVGLKPGENIEVRIRAKNRNGWGRFSSNDQIISVGKVPGKMLKPRIQEVVDMKDRIKISWDKCEHDC